jgi:phospholipid/cholesterol/gamma-HCH transport system substrate-binding protein
MENQRRLQYKVGIFVALSLILSLAFIVVLGGDKAFMHRSIILRMKANETGGLNIGSIVQIAGINCGNVIGLDFDDSNKVITTLRVDRKFLPRLTKGSMASLQTQGALGDKYVLIRPGPPSNQTLGDGEFIEIEGAEDLISTLGRSGNKIEKAFDILEQVDHLTQTLNQKNFAGNLAETSRNLKTSTDTLQEILLSVRGVDPRNNKLKKSLDHIESILAKIDSGEGTLGGLISDPTVHEDLKELLGGAKRSTVLKYLIRQAVKGGEEDEKQRTKDKK